MTIYPDINKKITRQVFIYVVNVILFSCLYVNVFAQYTLPVPKWTFGFNAGLDFTSGSPVPFLSAIYTQEGCASVCDTGGELLFYTDGSFVYDRNHTVMPNGEHLSGIILNPAFPHHGATISSGQGGVIVPMPGNDHLYYVFTITQYGTGSKFYYSIVDMDLRGGLGDVVAGNKGVHIGDNFGESMIAVTGDCCNIWLINTRDSIYAYEITAAGINLTPVISPGTAGHTGPRIMKISPDRKKVVITREIVGDFSLFDFDPGSGILSNERRLASNLLDIYGACFSPDNTKLYASNAGNIFQYDLSLPTFAEVLNSRLFIGNCNLTDLKVGPDGRIYFQSPRSNDALGTINNPNAAGAACQYNPVTVTLSPGSSLWVAGLPNDVPKFTESRVNNRFDVQVCFDTDTVLRASDLAGCKYVWNDGSTDVQRTVTGPGVYYVDYNLGTCTKYTDTFHVNFSGVVPAYGVRQNCRGTAYAWLSLPVGNVESYTYTWTDAAGNTLQVHNSDRGDTLFNIMPGEYRALQHSVSGCDSVFKFVVNPYNYEASFTVDPIVCQSETISFANTSGNAFTAWLWEFGDGATSTEENPFYQYPEPGDYMVRLIGYVGNGCNDTIDHRITVDTVPVVNFTTDMDRICAGGSVLFTPVYTSGAIGVQWNFGDGNTGSSLLPVRHVYNRAGNNTVTMNISYRRCPVTGKQAVIEVLHLPFVDAGPEKVITQDVQVQLDGSAESGTTIEWTPSLYLSSDNILRPFALPPTDQLYYLAVKDANDCFARDSVWVRVQKELRIPNIFTPNGDGIHDTWIIQNLYNYPKNLVQVFNRYGQLIFVSTGYAKPWDGTIRGKDVPVGTYYYIIDLKNGRKIYSGFIDVLR